MIHLYDDSPIIACSTGTGKSAISLIRISGLPLSKFLKYTRRFAPIEPENAPIEPVSKSAPMGPEIGPIEPKRLYLTYLIEGNGNSVDHILFSYFKAPYSFTGEDVIEIHSHGNPFIVRKIIKLIIECREARPGEFSYRALKNKKLNLSQVEGLDVLLNANSTGAINSALSILDGQLHDEYKNLRQSFLNHKSSVEMGIDFSDDIGEETFKHNLLKTLEVFSARLKTLQKKCINNPSSLINLKITLFGTPNSGKSSLFNNFLNSKRAIVSDIAGTTRDYITEPIFYNDVGYELIDTAGLRETDNKVEKAGIDLTKKIISESFYNMLVINPLDFDLSYIVVLLRSVNIAAVVFTHKDHKNFDNLIAPIEPLIKNKTAHRVNNLSFTEGDFDSVFERINKNYLDVFSSNPILLSRHTGIITDISEKIAKYTELIGKTEDIAIISSELNTIDDCLSELVGIVSPTEVLNNIFQNFCIGK